jgi:RecA-family ATPase
MPLFTGRQLLKENVRVEYLLPPFLTKGGTMLLAAPLKSMKTFLGLHMGAAIASGRPFIDMSTEQARVLYIDFEIGVAEAKTRYRPMEEHYEAGDNFFIRTADESPLSLDTGTNGHTNFVRLLESVKPAVVFIDTLRMVTHGEENSSTDMMKVMMNLRQLKLHYNFTAVLIHHMGKENTDERQTAPRTSRGSSVIEDSPDTIGYITKHATNAEEPSRISIRWKFRNHAPVDDSRYSFDASSGLFTRTTKKVKVKHVSSRIAEENDLSEGLLPAV